MILIHWLKFLFLIFSYLSTNYIFLTMLLLLFFLIYDSVFRIYDLHSYSVSFKNILSLSSFHFFPSSSFFPFIFFPHFPFVFVFCYCFFPPYFPLFSFPSLHHFLNLVSHFLRAPLPCSRTFCCPAGR